MALAKRLPILFVPRTCVNQWFCKALYWLRRELLLQIKTWHAYAKARSAKPEIAEDLGIDPHWGCKMIQDRYKTLRAIQSQDDDSIASTDLVII